MAGGWPSGATKPGANIAGGKPATASSTRDNVPPRGLTDGRTNDGKYDATTCVHTINRDGTAAGIAVDLQPPPSDNIARGKPATSSSVGWNGRPAGVTDGATNNGKYSASTCAHTNNRGKPSWVAVDLGAAQRIDAVTVVARSDCCPTQSKGLTIRIGDTGTAADPVCKANVDGSTGARVSCDTTLEGRHVSVHSDSNQLVICEIEAHEKKVAAENETKPATPRVSACSRRWGRRACSAAARL